VGQTPILREWCTRDHLSAISTISPEGKLYFHSQDRALDSADVVAFLEHLLREVPGRMVLIWDGAPIHRSHAIKGFLANGAALRIHLERLPAYAPELSPGEGLWQQLEGVELRNVCCFNLLHPTHELRGAVKRVRRKPRLIKSFFTRRKTLGFYDRVSKCRRMPERIYLKKTTRGEYPIHTIWRASSTSPLWQ
jgi:transposase